MSEEKKYPPATVGQIIEALKKLDPNKPLVFGIRQYNKLYARTVTINPSPDTMYLYVNEKYGGAHMEISLPYGAIISRWPDTQP
jgi:hypothetical protein